VTCCDVSVPETVGRYLLLAAAAVSLLYWCARLRAHAVRARLTGGGSGMLPEQKWITVRSRPAPVRHSGPGLCARLGPHPQERAYCRRSRAAVPLARVRCHTGLACLSERACAYHGASGWHRLHGCMQPCVRPRARECARDCTCVPGHAFLLAERECGRAYALCDSEPEPECGGPAQRRLCAGPAQAYSPCRVARTCGCHFSAAFWRFGST
jgi:hypothetical protein